MKKVIATLLALVLCLSLAGCKNEEDYSTNLITGYKSGDVTLGQYTGLTYVPMSTDVSEEEVQEKLDEYLFSYKSKVEVTDRDTVQDGDLVVIDFEGYKDGELVEGLTGSKNESSPLRIGSGTFFAGFEEALIGHSKGEFNIEVTFPENSDNEDLAGKPIQFKITLNKIYEYDIPEATDEFIAEKTTNKYTTVEAYKDNIRSQIKSEKEEEALLQKQDDIAKKLIENCTYNIDMEAEIQRGYQSLRDYNDKMTMGTYGMDAAGFYYTYYGLPTDQYEEMLRSQAEFSVRYEYARCAVAEAERFVITDEDIEELAKKQMEQYAYGSLDAYYEKIEELNGIKGPDYVKELVKLNKAAELIFDTAIPVDSE